MTFTREDCTEIFFPHFDPLIIIVEIAKQPIYRVLIDTGAEVNVIYKNYWDKMDVGSQHLVRATTSIVGFSRESMRFEGKVTVPVTTQNKKRVVITCPQEFYIIKAQQDITAS